MARKETARSNRHNISGGVVHTVPADLRKALIAHTVAIDVWEDITPLARNEWICWVISAKQQETRDRRIRIMTENLLAGKRRPCCWAGCMHRKDKPMSGSQKYILSKTSQRKS